MRRSLGAALWFLAGLLACFLGALAALTGTGAGRTLLARSATRALANVVAGRIEIGGVSGSLLTGIVLFDVRLYDADTSLVAWLPRAELSYNPFDLAAGRIVLQEARLREPDINLVQHANGRLNLEELFRLGVHDSTKPPGPPALILFRNVTIEDGSLVLRLQDRPDPGDSTLEIDTYGGDGRRRIRRFEHLDARIAQFRVSAPRERGIRVDVTRLAVESSDPHLAIRDLRGHVSVVDDSLVMDLATLRLPGSALAVSGRLAWPRDTVLYDLDVAADSATLSDLWWIDPRFPAGAVLQGAAQLRSHGGRLLEVRLDPMDVAYAGGFLSGHVTAFSLADSGLVRVQQGDLLAANFDLEFARPFLDTLPFAGRLDGHTLVDGPVSDLDLDVDWVFRDSLVPGRAESRIRGRGKVDLLDPAGLAFHPFAVEAATVALGTVRNLVPAFTLQGELDAAGTLSGPYTDATFSGTLRHRDGELPASVVRGLVRLDSRGDTLGVSADVTLDSLALAGFQGSFPALPVTPTLAGTVRLAGNLASLETHADLTTGTARLRGDGVLTLSPPALGARDFTLRVTDLNLQRWRADAPATRLTATVHATVRLDSAAPPVGAVTAELAPSVFAGSPLDTGVAAVHFADGRLIVDSLRLAQSGLITTATGSLAWSNGALARGAARADAADPLELDLDADSLSSLDSLVAWVAGLTGRTPGPGAALAGAARAHVALRGALDSLGITVDASGQGLRWREWSAPAAEAHVALDRGSSPGAAAFDVDVHFDSLARERLGFGAVQVRARGSRDSLGWFARSRIGDLGAFLAGGRYTRGEHVVLGVDSLAVLLPDQVWFLDRPLEVGLDDSLITIPPFDLRASGGPGRLSLHGRLPRQGAVLAGATIEGFPLAGLYSLLELDTVGVAGTLSAALDLTGTRAAPVYAGNFALKDGALGTFRAPAVDGTLEYRDRRLNSALHLYRGDQQVLSVAASLPLDLALVPVARRRLPDSLSVRATADRVDLAVLEAFTPLVRDVRGTFTADLGIGGTWERPRLRGETRLADVAATIPSMNVRYENVSGRLSLTGDTIRVDTLAGRSGEGSAAVTGFIRLEELSRPVLALDIRASRFRALELRNYLSVTASGDLSLRGPVLGATLTGQGTVTSGVLYFADLVNKRVVNLDEPWVASLIDTSLSNAIRRQRLGTEFESRFLDSLRIQNLQLAMGSDVWLRSTEANIQLQGSLAVNKERDLYRMSGTLQAPRGTYRLVMGPVTREFVVTQGTVRYFGTPDLDAELNIEARHVMHIAAGGAGGAAAQAAQDLAVTAHIGGTLLVPRLSLSAAEAGRQLSQTEIISYLLFGKSSFELTTDQGGFSNQTAMLRSTVASLVSGELERTLVSDLGVPLDYVEIRPGDPNDPFSGALFAAGWQIGRKTFLGLNAGFCQGREINPRNTLGASLQFRFSPEWRTEASFEPVRTCGDRISEQNTKVQRQLGLDLFWERRF